MEIIIIGLLAGLFLSTSSAARGWVMYKDAKRQAEIDHQQLMANIRYLQACIQKREQPWI